MSLFTFATEKNYQELVESAVMKTQLRKKYERNLTNILDELEDGPNIEVINNDLKDFSEPSNISHLNELIEKLKEIAVESGLDVDNEAPFKLTDSQIITLNIFYKL